MPSKAIIRSGCESSSVATIVITGASRAVRCLLLDSTEHCRSCYDRFWERWEVKHHCASNNTSVILYEFITDAINI